jgi:hypothetical protein
MLILIATELPHDLLPVWPALALAKGGAWSWWRWRGIFREASAAGLNCARIQINLAS